MFLYWGRRGAGPRLAYELHREALLNGDIRPILSVSRQSANFAAYRSFGDSVFPVDTFVRGIGAASGLWRVPLLRAALAKRIGADRIGAVVSLMPHVWNPFVISAVRRAGAHYTAVMHNASAHPGDETGLVNGLTLLEARRADLVVTLSSTVREQLVAGGQVPADRIVSLFLPDLSYADKSRADMSAPGQPVRLLFLGRIRRYKGLGLLVEALEALRERGRDVRLSICGEGPIEPYRERLLSLGATIINRWLSEDEISQQLACHDAVVLSHTSASQSGVAAAAFGAGLPVIATPVGGLTEQVVHRVNGVLATAATADALADAIAAFVGDRQLIASLRDNIRSNEEHSMRSFLQKLVQTVRARQEAVQGRP